MGAFLEFGETLRLPWRAVSEAGVLLYRGVAGGWSSAGDALSRMHARSRQCVDLSELEDRLLRDVGLTRNEAQEEIRRLRNWKF